MRRYNHLFFIVCLVITTGFLWTYLFFANYFNSSLSGQNEAARLRESLEESRFQVVMLQHQMRDLEQTVAAALPKTTLAKKDIYKNLLMTIRAPASIPAMDLSSVILEKGKKYFTENQYALAVEEFSKIKNQYPSSAYQIQARFFLAESLFHQRQFKKCVEVIDEMVLQFPEHELTGFILLRLGQISEYNNQVDEAGEIFRTVRDHFPQKELKAQARVLLKSLEIQ